MIHTYERYEAALHDRDIEIAVGKLQDGEDMPALFTFNIKTEDSANSTAIVDEKHVFKFMEKLDLNSLVSYYVHEITANGVGGALTSDGVWNSVFIDDQEAEYVSVVLPFEEQCEIIDAFYGMHLSACDDEPIMPDAIQLGTQIEMESEVHHRYINDSWESVVQYGVYSQYWQEFDVCIGDRRYVFEQDYLVWFRSERDSSVVNLMKEERYYANR